MDTWEREYRARQRAAEEEKRQQELKAKAEEERIREEERQKKIKAEEAEKKERHRQKVVSLTLALVVAIAFTVYFGVAFHSFAFNWPNPSRASIPLLPKLLLCGAVLGFLLGCCHCKAEGTQVAGVWVAVCFGPFAGLVLSGVGLLGILVFRGLRFCIYWAVDFVRGPSFSTTFVWTCVGIALLGVFIWLIKSDNTERSEAVEKSSAKEDSLALTIVNNDTAEDEAFSAYKQCHEDSVVSITTRLTQDQSIELRWQFKEAPSLKGLKLFGYRNETGFNEHTLPKKDHGKLIVSACRDNLTYEFLKPGVEYFYTFVATRHVKEWFSSVEQCESAIRFKITIPLEADILAHAKKFNALLDETVRSAERRNTLTRLMKTVPEEHRSPLEKILRAIESEVDIDNGIREYRRKFKVSLEARGLSPNEQEEALRDFDNIVFQVTSGSR